MKKLVLLVISAFVLSSCNNNPKESNSNQETAKQAEHHQDDEHAEAIQLNHSEKWVVNNEMKPFVLEGESLVNNYLQNKQTDYKALASQVKAQNSMLVKSCTMDGKSHEELHKWLHPHLELVKALENAADTVKAADIVTQLQDSYQLYHQYFN